MSSVPLLQSVSHQYYSTRGTAQESAPSVLERCARRTPRSPASQDSSVGRSDKCPARDVAAVGREKRQTKPHGGDLCIRGTVRKGIC